MRRLVPFLVLIAACSKDEETDGGDTNEQEIVWEEATGDLACYTPGAAWLTQTVDDSKQLVVAGDVFVADFQLDDAVPEAKVDVWFADDVTGTADSTGTTGEDGHVTLDVKTCTPISYKTAKDPLLDETVDTYEAHQVVLPDEPVTTTFNSVSTTTYSIIPSLLGISPIPGLGIIAGTAFDCAEMPIENARVTVVDANGAEPPDLIVKYFVDDFPNRDQPDTSPDGLWVAINVPAGEWTVQLQTQRAGAVVLSGSTVVQSYPDSINISNIYTGYPDGVKYPATCLVAE